MSRPNRVEARRSGHGYTGRTWHFVQVTSLADRILHVSPVLAATLIFLLPFAESAIFVGFIFPGETAAVIAGVLAYEHTLPLPVSIITVIVAAILGDNVGYFVGHKWGNRLLEGPLSRWIKPEHVQRTRETISRRGGFAVFVGRWTAALRALVPGLAALAEVPYRTFLLWNAIGGIVWGATFVMLGYGAGASWRSVAHTASTAGSIGVGAVAAVIIAFILFRRLRRRRAEAGATAKSSPTAESGVAAVEHKPSADQRRGHVETKD